MEDLIHHLSVSTEENRVQFREGFAAFAARHDLSEWEGWFSPCDEEVHSQILRNVDECDEVLDLGAGDLRLALRMAEQVRRVYAVEVSPIVLGAALREIGFALPRNLHVICANALDMAIPPGVTVAVLLMRHCHHFSEYFDRLLAAGCHRLITNVRWKSSVELIDLTRSRVCFDQVQEGWFACRCGAVGYVGLGERSQNSAVEVSHCPTCQRC
ncbi:MAG: class I SAM-dependent methyltransferase [Anaerolineae bacterium]|nr:class I SAM-dependent methyltransferase [Anaerolineae bacterium]